MRPRDPTELFRAASPLELFFDLIFVVAVSLSSAQLHHAEAADELGVSIGSYLMVFFAIWWAWMNFTWFASAFDTDDWLYRLFVLTQMAGAIVLAVGTGPAMTSRDWSVVIVGYVMMRLALVVQWLRASRSHPELRRTAQRYAVGIVIVQVLWVCYPLVPGAAAVPMFLLLVLLELAVPAWAEQARLTPWHAGHIADRYGCFTLIVLGESVLASTTAVAGVLDGATHVTQLMLIGLGGFVLAAGMWWTYFSVETSGLLTSLKKALFFGYGHYVVFAAAGAFSAGISVLLAVETGAVGLAPAIAVATLTVPVGLFVMGVWLLILRHFLPLAHSVLMLACGVLLGGCAFVALAAGSVVPGVLAAAGVMVLLIVCLESSGVRLTASTDAA